MKPIIIAIVGNSGSGKTYMAEFLKRKMNIPVIVSYTTRPIRPSETNGVDHWFVKKLPKPKERMAFASFGGFHYCALHSQVPVSGMCSYVIDEKGLEEMTLNHSDKYTIIAVNVVVSEEVLIERGIPIKRMNRDKNRRKLHDEYYDKIIINNGTIEEFEEKILAALN